MRHLQCHLQCTCPHQLAEQHELVNMSGSDSMKTPLPSSLPDSCQPLLSSCKPLWTIAQLLHTYCSGEC